MKCSESWLREWVNPSINREQLCNALTMAGLEVESIDPVAQEFTNVVVGEVLVVEKHPEADRLHLCKINVGDGTLQIVCGADNVRPGIKIPVAKINSVLPNQKVITETKFRGALSQGMLCSASDLGLAEQSQGLLELPDDAPLGHDLKTYLMLDDFVIDISLTPNRGDCLSVRGIAREISALTQSPLEVLKISEIKPASNVEFKVNIEAKTECPRYVGRVIQQIKTNITSPIWLKERLRRSGIRSIHPVVDVTNYVMLELGQPMHAFDIDCIEKEIQVRQSKAGEIISLLDDSEVELDSQTLVIADAKHPLAIAGVMGGVNSSVTSATQNIFLESAFFIPEVVAKQRQRYNLNSDSAHRFERGVDPTIQREALERATQLILELAGGIPGPVVEIAQSNLLPQKKVVLKSEKIKKILGIEISDTEVEAIFDALKFSFKHEKIQWEVSIPAYRFDINIPEDLIEEIARLYGYDKIPTHTLEGALRVTRAEEGAKDLSPLRHILKSLGYHEVITYSFVDPKLQQLLAPEHKACELVNPITAEMTVMRTNLWSGLINTLLYNKSRQQHRVRLFEIGACFVQHNEHLQQQMRIGGLVTGSAYAEQWGIASREVDFYDIKGDIEHIFQALVDTQLDFKTEQLTCSHPGQTAGIYIRDQKIGVIGALHPSVLQALDITNKVFLFEFDQKSLENAGLHNIIEISKFPEIRRDIALLVNQAIPAGDIQDTIKEIAGDWLKDVFIFDVYQGKGISPDLKSIALGLIWQHPTRTLVDDEVTGLMERVITTLKGKLGAELRR